MNGTSPPESAAAPAPSPGSSAAASVAGLAADRAALAYWWTHGRDPLWWALNVGLPGSLAVVYLISR
jgi:hypothetical protein